MLNWNHSGLRVAQLKVIFTLPSYFCTAPLRLAYIEWFRPFTAKDQDTGLYVLSRSTRGNHANAEVVPLEQIVRSCHLAPRFGTDIDPAWTRESVLEQCSSFFVNRYLNLNTFDLFS